MTEKTNTLPTEVNEQIIKAKADGHLVFSINISGIKYIYRSINRAEFRELQEQLTNEAEKAKADADKAKKGLPADSPELEAINNKLEREALLIRDRGEDRLVAKGLIYPVLNINSPAGIATTIADRIMAGSGFGSEEEPELI